jgi:phospholipid transport system substrate-binding protein
MVRQLERIYIRGRVPMVKVLTLQCTLVFLLIIGISVPSMAGEPTEKIKQTTDRILAIVSDPELATPDKDVERKRLIREAVGERFDWEEMSRRTLARHWRRMKQEDRERFVDLFSRFLERNYTDKLDGYADVRINYLGDSIEGHYGTVKVKIVTQKETEIPVSYRVKKKGDEWYVYDISIEGVCLINNYRSQFNSIIVKSSYEELFKRLEAKW